jgi:hypothetical protein
MAENITVSKRWLLDALKKLSTAEFYRNLVAVIIGIIITFGGSSFGNVDAIDAALNNNWRPMFVDRMNEGPWMRDHIINIAAGHYGFLKSTAADQLVEAITKVTEMIDKEIGH